MPVTYSETIDFLYSRLPMFSRTGSSALKKDLTNIRALCSALGDPQKRFKSIHVGGTNGKGSVSHMLAAVLHYSGYKTGLHTSPHLTDFRERIRVNGQMAPKAFVIDFVERNKALIGEVQPSFFELSVAMAFAWFAESKVEVAVVEVGLGGRLDSTNILHPDLSVITNISLDHMQFLGNTRELIAREKAGIIKLHTPVVIGATDQETAPVFKEKADRMKAPLYFADQLFEAAQKEGRPGVQQITVYDEKKKAAEFTLDLLGKYQAANLQTVLGAIKVLNELGWHLNRKKVKAALSRVKSLTGMRGRWEVLKQEPCIIADVAHNSAGIQQVMEQVTALPYAHLYIIMGFVKDKSVGEVLRFCPPEAAYLFCQADSPRALAAEALKQLAAEAGLKGTAFPSVRSAYHAALDKAGIEDVILICGSTFVVAEVLE